MMTVAFVEQSAESLQLNPQRKNSQNTPTGSEVFSSLLYGRLPSNIVFTRVDTNLEPPKAGEKRESDPPLAPRRGSGRDDQVANDDSFRNTIERDSYNAANDRPVANDAPRDDSSAYDQAEASPQQANGNAQQQAAEARRDSQNDQGQKTAAAQAEASAAAAGPVATQANAKTIVDPNAGAATRAKSDAAAAKFTVDPALQRAADLNPQAAAKANKQAQNNGGIRATVTRTAEPLSAQPQTSLASQSSLTAQQTSDAGSRNTAVRDAGLSALADDAALVAEGAGKSKARTGIVTEKGQNAGQPSEKIGQQQQQGPDLSALAAQAVQNQQTVAAAATANVQQSPGSMTNAQAGQSMAIDSAAGASQLNGTTSGAQQRATVAQAHTPQRPQAPQQALADQVAVQINKAAANGLDRINIQLRPPELGRVDVKMEVGHDNRVTAVITVERQETLDMLRQDSRILSQALQDAGLQTDQNSLSFNLQGQEGQSANANDNNAGGASGGAGGEDQSESAIEDGLLALGETPTLTEDGRLDVKV